VFDTHPAAATRRTVAAIAAVALGVAACSAGASPSPSPEPTATPAPSIGVASGDCPTSPPDALPAGETRQVTIDTDLGSIVIDVEADVSPIATGNFVALAECGFYDNVVFHRVVPGFVVQGGDGENGSVVAPAAGPPGTGGPGYGIPDEPLTGTYSRGTVAMARTQAPDSQGSQFFVVLDDSARSSLESSAFPYAIIGTVGAGMDVVDAIAAAADAENPTNPVVMTDVSVSGE
jgi:cyclophilin family peptidyl-prolyl cis-trans isomerase